MQDNQTLMLQNNKLTIQKDLHVKRFMMNKQGKFVQTEHALSQSLLQTICNMTEARGVLNDQIDKVQFIKTMIQHYVDRNRWYFGEQVAHLFKQEKKNLLLDLKRADLIENNDFKVISKDIFESQLKIHNDKSKQSSSLQLAATDFLPSQDFQIVQIDCQVSNGRFNPIILSQSAVNKLQMYHNKETRNYYETLEQIFFDSLEMIDNDSNLRIKDLFSQLSQQEILISELKQEKSNRDQTIQEIQQELQDKDQTIQEIQEELSQKDQTIQDIQEEIQDKQENIESLQRQHKILTDLSRKYKEGNELLQSENILINKNTFSQENKQQIQQLIIQLVDIKDKNIRNYASTQTIVYLFEIYDVLTNIIHEDKIGRTTYGRLDERTKELQQEIYKRTKNKSLALRLITFFPVNENDYEKIIHDQIKLHNSPIQPTTEYYVPNDTVIYTYLQFKQYFEDIYERQQDEKKKMREFIETQMQEQIMEIKEEKRRLIVKEDYYMEQMKRLDEKREYLDKTVQEQMKHLEEKREHLDEKREHLEKQLEDRKTQFNTQMEQERQIIQQQLNIVPSLHAIIARQQQTIMTYGEDRLAFIENIIQNIRFVNPGSLKSAIGYLQERRNLLMPQ